MVVSLSGSTGFIGRALMKKMVEMGWTVREINRGSMSLSDQEFCEQKTEGTDAVINLAGAPVSKKWTPAYKLEIMNSRVNITRKISESIINAKLKPSVFISTSAIGIYDSVNLHSESSVAFADSYLAKVCRNWENEAMKSNNATRVVIFRMGVVLGEDGGALEKMRLPFSIGLGAKLGSGKQAVSFIHLSDLIAAIIFTIENPAIIGIVNAVSPYPTNNAEFTDKLGKVFDQPSWLTIPAFALKMIYGEGAQVFLVGQKVIPEKLLQAGFRFTYPTIQNTLVQIYR
ncbi:MAG: TIGR01777 family oxidoreductase [Bacteroidales bacterium]|nr:TIGR01777 family oxidoreductase [Bacteroidales bacterium]